MTKLTDLTSGQQTALLSSTFSDGMAAFQNVNRALLTRILNANDKAKVSNPRTAGLYSGTVTITDSGATVPTETPAPGYFITTTSAGVWHVVGGQIRSSGGPKASTVNATTDLSTWSRHIVRANSRYVTLRLRPTTVEYRFIVDGRYVSLAGTILGVTTGSTTQHIMLDFGTRADREIQVECQQGAAGCFGAYVEPTGKMYPVERRNRVAGVFLGDSYIAGTLSVVSGTYNRADGVSAQFADYIGMDIQASGSGGTGWNTDNSTAYRFDERIFAGDLNLSVQKPEVLFFMASINDRSREPAGVQANVLSGLTAARAQFPLAPIVVFGIANVPIGPQSGSPSLVTAENSVQAAIATLNDPLIAFIPMISDPNGSWFSGTGRVGSTNNSGNNDWAFGPDGSHLSNPEGVSYLAKRYADSAITALANMLT